MPDMLEYMRWCANPSLKAVLQQDRNEKIMDNTVLKTTIPFVFPLLIALMCDALSAEPIDVNGRFRSKTPGGFPDGWVMHEWGGYKPFPEVKTIPGAYEGSTALSITNVLGDDGGAIQTRTKFPARSGSVGRISFLAKGKGLAWATFYRWGEKGAWNGVVVSSPFTLSDTWQPHVLTIPIDNGHACETHAVSLAIGGKMGAEILVCSLTLDIQPTRVVGDTRMPKSWTIFGPVDKALKPSREQLQSIPETFGGAKAQTVPLISNTLDLAPLAGSGPSQCLWAFGRIEAKYDCDMTVGAGAGGAMQYHLNGEPVFDIPAPGNAQSPVEIDNHVKNVRLQKGTNVIAVRIVADKGSAILKLAGPLDLRGESKTSSTPFKIDLVPQFDPVKAGWKKVFDEEFDGDRVDTGKWYFSPTSEKDYAKVHDGLLEIVCNWATPDKTKTKSASLYSNEVFGYGYFETRVKFRQQSGWWSAFWLCTHGPSNPFLDGWEIDVYEDYYMGPKNPGEEPRGVLDHNLHVFACGTLRSWNYGSKLPGKVDDWYVVACKWTPFEVSYYLNGKLIQSEANHSPYSSVTFDPFNHATGYVPLHAILSGCCGKSGGDPTKGKFPESFFVDYVRIYEYPHDSDPVVRLARKPDESTYILKPGEELHLEAQVEPSPITGAKIKQVYLFDSGALLDYRSAPPYDFVVRITQDYYNGTNFVKPGRTGVRPDWDRGLHAFCIFAQDERGNVGRSENVVRLLRKNGKTGPYLGKPIQLPGEIMLSHYDEGGQGFAYSDGTPGNSASKTFRANEDVDAGETVIGGVSGGEWLKYTVHVNQTANYTFTLDYGTPSPKQRGPKLMVDCKAAGDFETPAHEFPDWRHTSKAVLKSVPLTAGDHEIVLLMQGSYNLGGLKVEAE